MREGGKSESECPLDVFVGVKPDDTAGEGIGPSALWEEKGGRRVFIFLNLLFILKSDRATGFCHSQQELVISVNDICSR